MIKIQAIAANLLIGWYIFIFSFAKNWSFLFKIEKGKDRFWQFLLLFTLLERLRMNLAYLILLWSGESYLVFWSSTLWYSRPLMRIVVKPAANLSGDVGPVEYDLNKQKITSGQDCNKYITWEWWKRIASTNLSANAHQQRLHTIIQEVK